jgi:hypothetical protein
LPTPEHTLALESRFDSGTSHPAQTSASGETFRSRMNRNGPDVGAVEVGALT